MADALTAMLSIVRVRLTGTGPGWLDANLAAIREGDEHRILAAFTAASRHAGMAALSLAPDERAAVAAIVPGLSCDRWTTADAARAVLLMSANDAAARACFENGDAREQESWLRALSLMPHRERFLTVAVDACRSHIQPLFESIACENPYAADYFSDGQFNQMVLKAMFTGVRLERIVGLARRLNPDLSRMARDYAAERRAAGRRVPEDLSLALHDARELEEHLS